MQEKSDKKILVIGGSGYIGSELIRNLDMYYHMESVDLEWFGPSPRSFSQKKDYNDLSKEYLDTFDVIILLAGHSSVKMCASDLYSSFNNNVRNFVNLVQKLDKQKFIYASSASVYGNINETTVTEENRNFSPINYYDMTKLHIDHVAELSNLEYYGLRFGTVNGPSSILRNDVMINAMTSSAINNGEVNVFNPDTRRSILGLKDLIRAVEKIIRIGSFEKRGLYNLSSFTSTAQEIGEGVAKVLGVPCKITEPPKEIFNEKLQNKTYDFALDTTKFEKVFRFRFLQTLEYITEDLKENDVFCFPSDRSKPVHYS